MKDKKENNNEFDKDYKKGLKRLNKEKELKKLWHQEIMENASIQEYFKNFHPDSVELFISFYLSQKFMVYKYGDFLEQQAEELHTRWIDEAHQHLDAIQNKKLFDLQCLWLAEQVTIEEVKIAYDFYAWQEDTLNCPFLEPITKADIEMYQDFLLTSEVDLRFLSGKIEWQNYDALKQSYLTEEEGVKLPEWYEYHNQRTGNSKLMFLPNFRGEKEQFYVDLYLKDMAKNTILPEKPEEVIDERPLLSPEDEEKLQYFVNTFEDEETRKRYTNYTRTNKKIDLKDLELNKILSQMEREEENIPIEAHHNYREAIYKAYYNFKRKKIAEHLPMAHEQYLFNRKMGLVIPPKDDFFQNLRTFFYDMIIKGRALNGESEDFNF